MAVMRKATPIIWPFKRIHYNEEDHRKTYKDQNRLWPPIKLSAFSPLSIVNHCICGNLTTGANTTCSRCLGLESLHLEGEIWKKQKKASTLKSYWFVLLGRELYSYRSQGDSKHKEMRALSGVYIKDEPDELDDNGTVIYPFMLIFPNKLRVYYFYKS